MPAPLISALIFIGYCIVLASSFRLFGSDEQDKPFAAYEKGFVGTLEDASVPGRADINPGHKPSNVDLNQTNRLQSCPDMIGPFGDDDRYYCSQQAGYCDRRSGQCHCFQGYAGSTCESCASTHIDGGGGGVCIAKKLCPNGCSGAGQCNYLTGVCQCDEFREGDDCSTFTCSRHHRHCTHCSNQHCTSCRELYGRNKSASEGEQCVPCSSIDPRCLKCSMGQSPSCYQCIDPLLLSTRRSGPREHDPVLPADEMLRELSTSLPFGSQDPTAFDEAEHFFVVQPEFVPLNASTVACDQGNNLDATIECRPEKQSHVVCGHYGVASFDSPRCKVREDEGFVRIFVSRTGGGVGEVSVEYNAEHITTNDSDFSPTAFYTTRRVITFLPGQVKQSFLVPIHDDRNKEDDECFSLSLQSYDGPVNIGNQGRTTVCIIDDDSNRTCSLKSELIHPKSHTTSMHAIAGHIFPFQINAQTCLGKSQTGGGDNFFVVANHREEENVQGEGIIQDVDNGTYDGELTLLMSGEYDLNVMQIIPGGLRGEYFNSALLSEDKLEKTRIDASINFTFGLGPISTFSSDFASVRWSGLVQAEYTGTFMLYAEFDDHVRIFIDDALCIDSWTSPNTTHGNVDPLTCEVNLSREKLTPIRIEYRALTGSSRARLGWSSANVSKEIIPSSALYYLEHIMDSPFRLIVKSGPTAASTSAASGEGLRFGVVGREHRFDITPLDEFFNLRNDFDATNDTLPEQDGFHAVARLIENHGEGVGAEMVTVEISYNQEENKYEAVYTPTISGVWSVDVTLSSSNLLGSNVAGDHIVGSPYKVETFSATTSAFESKAYGSDGNCTQIGPFSSLTAGEEFYFFIQALDSYRNKNIDGSDNWVITLHEEAGAKYIRGSFQLVGGGLYTASIVPLVAGENTLGVTLDGLHIKGSPFLLNVRPGEIDGPASDMIQST